MSVMCSICQDFLTERPQVLQPNDDVNICALSCGHLFHRVCVNQWFQSQNAQARQRLPAGEGRCPCCKKCVNLATALRIFPTGDEDANTVVQQKHTLEAALKENQKLTTDLNDLRSLYGQKQSELDEEVVCHDMLKLEYVQVFSEKEAIKEQLNENLTLKIALENSVKSITEKLEKEKAEALKKISEMEAREAKLLEEIDALKIADKENIKALLLKGQGPQHPLSNSQSGVSSIQNLSKGLNIVVQSRDDQTSDGESPSSSPSSSQPKQNLFPHIMPFSNEEESEIDDTD